jgi:hypothetical protein
VMIFAVWVGSTTYSREVRGTADLSASPELVASLISVMVRGWKAWENICQKASPRSFDFAPQGVPYSIDLLGASLRMTALWG